MVLRRPERKSFWIIPSWYNNFCHISKRNFSHPAFCKHDDGVRRALPWKFRFCAWNRGVILGVIISWEAPGSSRTSSLPLVFGSSSCPAGARLMFWAAGCRRDCLHPNLLHFFQLTSSKNSTSFSKKKPRHHKTRFFTQDSPTDPKFLTHPDSSFCTNICTTSGKTLDQKKKKQIQWSVFPGFVWHEEHKIVATPMASSVHLDMIRVHYVNGAICSTEPRCSFRILVLYRPYDPLTW